MSTRSFASTLTDLHARPRRWLVTGGAGFIGSHLCEFLLNHGQEVLALDNFATGSRANLVPLMSATNKNSHKFKFVEGDIRDPEICARATKGMDVVLHQAALGSVPRSLTDPKATDETNVGGFINVLLAAKQNEVARFVFASSSSVYGDCEDSPKVESRLGQPLSPYAVSKIANELYARVFARNYGQEIIGLRYFNVFGPRQNPDGPYAAVIPKWIAARMAGQTMLIHGDGSTSRDFCYIENVVQMNILAACTNDPEALQRMYNVACGAKTTLNDLAAIICEKIIPRFLPEESVRHIEKRAGDVQHSLASIQLAREFLNYQPSFGFAKGMEKTIDWYLKYGQVDAGDRSLNASIGE